MKPIPLSDFPHYFVSEDGAVFSCITLGKNPKIRAIPREIKGYVDDDGYRQVLLCRKPNRKRYAVHILVLLAYVGPRPSANHEGRHLDGNRSNNNVVNLAWGTRKENGEDKVKHGNSSRGEINPKAKITQDLVIKIRAMVASGLSKCEVGRRVGLSNMQVGKIARRSPGGWGWLST